MTSVTSKAVVMQVRDGAASGRQRAVPVLAVVVVVAVLVVAVVALLAAVRGPLGVRLSAGTAIGHRQEQDAQRPAAATGPITVPGRPLGPDGDWSLTFHDEFDGPSLDPTKWADNSTAEPDAGHGNPGNQQLEWNQAANCALGGGILTMTARREAFTAPSGTTYDWTSCLLTSTPSATFQYGFVEERAILPAARGFWPAFWTWQAPRQRQHIETDAYEFYSDNHRRLYFTQFSGGGGECQLKLTFDPTSDWHTYGVDIAPDGTTWYVDGAQVCHTDASSAGPTNLISNLAVYSKIQPDPGTTSATKRVDFIRLWTKTG